MESIEKYFDIAFSAPDGIKKLRQLILTLAMQGKLIPQDPNDETASELLKNILFEQDELINEKILKKRNPARNVPKADEPYDLPANWKWLYLTDTYFSIGGRDNQIQATEYKDSGFYPVIDQGKKFIAGFSDSKEKVIKVKKPLIVFGDHTKHLKLIDFDFIIGADGVKILVPYNIVSPRYFYYALNSFKIRDRGYSRHFKMLNENFLPLPPFNEQKKIEVAIESLMSKCDELEKLRNKKEQKRLDVHSGAINALLKATEENDFKKSWQFIAKNFSELYSVKENVVELRKAILQLAVMGKLVPQNSNDKPASELLKDILIEKEKLVKSGKIKKQKPLLTITEKEIPYQIPSNWVWARLSDVLDVRDGTHDSPKYVDVGIPLVTSKNLYTGILDFKNVKYITTEDHKKISERSKVDIGDILFAMIGSIGNPVIVNTDIVFSIKNVALFKFYKPEHPSNKFVLYFLFFAQKRMQELASGAVQGFVSLGFLREHLIPVPPLEEQNRIVKKIEQLFGFCDELEKLIHDRDQSKTSLLTSMTS